MLAWGREGEGGGHSGNVGYEATREDMGGYGVHRRVMGHLGIYGAQEPVGDMGHREPMGHRSSLGCGDLQGTHGVMKHRGPKKY